MKGKTIAAISTAQAPGGIGIVRISGPEAREVANRVFRAKSGKKVTSMKGYTALFGGVYAFNGEKIDDAIALTFSAPKSYTGEDVVELSCHGGLYVTRRLLREVIEAGASPAGAGEFTRRAFLNGKMDLAQAEAVMQMIGAQGEQAARAAEAAGSGVLSTRVRGIREGLMGLASHLSAWADFPEEEVPEVDEAELIQGLSRAERQLSALLDGFDTGKVFREGVETVIAGRPNAGKSTLMNLLAGCPRSIVTQYPGTTRDIVEETVLLEGIPLRLADTAGIRETEDPVEEIGVEAARGRLKTAQLILAVFDSSQVLEQEDMQLIEGLDPVRTVAVINKTDLEEKMDRRPIEKKFSYTACVSAATGEGLPQLIQAITAALHTENFDPGAGVLSTERQRDNARQALCAVQEALKALRTGLTFDAVTVCVEDGISALSGLVGDRVSDEIIDRVFENFCVGK